MNKVTLSIIAFQKCPYCGKRLFGAPKICPHCGKDISILKS